MWTLEDFVRESNLIEGIHRDPMDREIIAHEMLLEQDQITVQDLETFVAHVAGARLRVEPGMNVRVGGHVPPRGGPNILLWLATLLADANSGGPSQAYDIHVRYETVHPFMDGNGRSGRALWLWMMGGSVPLGFLHQFYYQTLQASGR